MLVVVASVIEEQAPRQDTVGRVFVDLNAARTYVLNRLSQPQLLDEDDRAQLLGLVDRGYQRLLQESAGSKEASTYTPALDQLLASVNQDLDDTASGELISLGPLMDHLIAHICPLWPFC